MNSEALAALFGLSALPATQPGIPGEGGTNYATSGARSDLTNGPGSGLFNAAVPMTTQINNYLSSVNGHAAPPRICASSMLFGSNTCEDWLTCTPPKPIQPPSGAASATRCPNSRIHVFTAKASCEAFSSSNREACWSVSMDFVLISSGLAP
jgi:hypothetical protein